MVVSDPFSTSPSTAGGGTPTSNGTSVDLNARLNAALGLDAGTEAMETEDWKNLVKSHPALIIKVLEKFVHGNG